MSNTSDTSTVDTPSNGSRFGRGFALRIGAVALFLGLGTFAVSQALKSKGDHDDHDHASANTEVSDEHSVNNQEAEDGRESLVTNEVETDSTFPSSSGSSFRSSTGDTPKVGAFNPPPIRSKTAADADRRPVVTSDVNKNLVAKPAVTPQNFQPSGGGGFKVNPDEFRLNNNQDDTAAEKPEENKPRSLDSSVADQTRDLLNRTPPNLADLKPPTRQTDFQGADETPRPNSTFATPNANAPRGNISGLTASPSNLPRVGTDNSFKQPPSISQPVVRQDDTTPANTNPDRRLAPLNGPGGLRSSEPTNSGFGNPSQNRNVGVVPPIQNTTSNQNLVSNQDLKPNRPLNENFNVQPRTQGSFQSNFNQQAAQNQTPNNNPPFNSQPQQPQQRPVDLGQNSNAFGQTPRQQPPTSIPVVQRNAVPTRNASSVRAMTPSTVVGGTLPTPGEKALEGTRTPSLTVQRIAPREIQLNTPATFEIIVRNVGTIEANDVRVYDQIPTGTELLEASPQPSRDASGAIQWELGNMASGQERRIKMKLKPTQPGEIGSVARVTFGTKSSVRTLVTKPVLEITHSAPSKSLIGDRVPLDIVVTNKGNGPAKQVVIQEDIPPQLEYADGFRQIEYEVGTLAPGQSRKLQLTLKAADVGKLRNIISANGAGGLNARHSIDMEIVAPNLMANASGPRRRYLRRNATHQFQVQNNGTAAATNVELMAKLPQGLKYVSSNNRGQYDQATNAVYWSLAELDAGVTASVELETIPVATGDQSISFNAVADLKQKATADAELLVEHLVDVFFDIDDIVDHIEIGSDTKYQIRVVNQGTKTATNVRLQLDLPPGLRPTNVEGGLQSQIQGQRVAFAPITSMNPGDEIKVEVTATGVTAGEHKIVASMQSDGRQTPISKEETTQVYSDR